MHTHSKITGKARHTKPKAQLYSKASDELGTKRDESLPELAMLTDRETAATGASSLEQHVEILKRAPRGHRTGTIPSVRTLIQLQRTHGNAYVQRLLQGHLWDNRVGASDKQLLDSSTCANASRYTSGIPGSTQTARHPVLNLAYHKRVQRQAEVEDPERESTMLPSSEDETETEETQLHPPTTSTRAETFEENASGQPAQIESPGLEVPDISGEERPAPPESVTPEPERHLTATGRDTNRTSSTNGDQSIREDPLASAVTSDAQRLETEAVNAAKQASQEQGEEEATSGPPAIQFRPLTQTGGNIIQRGLLDIVPSIRNLTARGWNAIRDIGRRLVDAYRQTEARSHDLYNSGFRIFRTFRNFRRQLFADAMREQRTQRTAAVSAGRMSREEAAEPTLLEHADDVARVLESGTETYFEITSEITEGALLGDFKENPTIWNTIGQIAIGFVPYAGQVADIRDLIAVINKLRKKGWRDGEWFNLVLTVIGIIPGVGDIIKAAGRGLKGVLGRGVRWVLRHGGDLWRSVTRRVRALLPRARQLGRRLLQRARTIGRRVLQGARQLGRRIVDGVRGVGQRLRGLVRTASQRVRRFAQNIRERASRAVNRARSFLGRIVGAIAGAINRALATARRLISRGAELVRNARQRGRQIFDGIRRRIAESARNAARFVGESVSGAVALGRRLYQRARQRMGAVINNAMQTGRRWATQGFSRVRSWLGRGMNWVRQRAIPWVTRRLGGIKDRLLNFLREKWERLKARFGRTGTDTRPKLSRGDLYEQQIKDRFRRKILRENEIIRDANGKIIGEIDFETAEAIVESGISLSDKLPQLHRLAELARQRAKRLDVIYDPTITPPGRVNAFRNSLRLKWGNRVRFIPINLVEP